MDGLDLMRTTRDRIFDHIREPCKRVGCEEELLIVFGPDGREQMYMAYHGKNPEHALPVPLVVRRALRDQRANQIRAWLERIHSPRPWETEARENG